MSNWDLGFDREPAGNCEPQYPQPLGGKGDPRGPTGPDGAASRSGNTGWPSNTVWFGFGGSPGDDSQEAPYPLIYERDDFDGGPPWQPADPQPAAPQATAPQPTAPQPADRFDGDQYMGGAPYGDEPWSAGSLLGNPDGADPMRALYPDNESGRRRWLILAGVAALAAVIGVTRRRGPWPPPRARWPAIRP
jgi:hypothetical protein